jgi:hypothetical protein
MRVVCAGAIAAVTAVEASAAAAAAAIASMYSSVACKLSGPAYENLVLHRIAVISCCQLHGAIAVSTADPLLMLMLPVRQSNCGYARGSTQPRNTNHDFNKVFWRNFQPHTSITTNGCVDKLRCILRSIRGIRSILC